MNTINETLLSNLFLNTKRETPQQEIYSFVKGRIFPNAKEYVHFLRLSDLNEKREVAKRIVKRLCMCSNYQPPYEMIINVSQQEKSKKNQSIDKNYIPQDHFVHVVNTYIFGVYLYFNHPSCSRELNLCFSDKRKEFNYSRKINTVNDFISSWKSFCLYHDIGYPFEIQYGKGHALTDERLKEMGGIFTDTQMANIKNIFAKGILTDEQIDRMKNSFTPEQMKNIKVIPTEEQLDEMKVFDNVYLHIKNQLSIKALAKLLVINNMIKEADKHKTIRTVSSILCYHFESLDDNSKPLHPDNMSFVNEYYEFEDIYSFEHIKMFLGFIDQADVMKILFCRVLGHPIAFAYFDKEKELVLYKNSDIALPISEQRLKNILRQDDKPYDSKFERNFEVKYYIKNPSELFRKSATHTYPFHEEGLGRALDDVLELVKEEEKIQIDFKHVNNEYDLDNLIFEIYESITRLLNKCLTFSEEEQGELAKLKFMNIFFECRRAAYQDYVKHKISKDIGSYLKAKISSQDIKMDVLLKQLLEADINEPSSFNGPILEYISDVFFPAGLTEITNNIVQQMTKNLQAKIARRLSLIRVYAIIANIIDSQCERFNVGRLISETGFDIQKLLNAATQNPRIRDEYSYIKQRLGRQKYVPIENVIKDYGRHTKYDHGICSAIIYLYINSVSAYLAESLDCKKDSLTPFSKMLIPLFWAINPKFLDQKLLSNYKHIREETFYAIFCHNIFADTANSMFDLNGHKKWTTRIDKEAFLYFCMLCDSLQHWDRERYYDPRKIDYTPLFAMDSYNINIINDKISIKTIAYTNYNDIIKEFCYDDFLEDCSKYLSLEIRHE